MSSSPMPTHLNVADQWLDELSDAVGDSARAWLTTGTWASRSALVKAAVDRDDERDLINLIQSVPPAVGRVEPPEQRLMLRARALARVPEAGEVLDGFVKVLLSAAELYRNSAEGESRLERPLLTEGIGMSDALATRVCEVASNESWIWFGGGGNPDQDGWYRNINEHFVPMLRVKTIDDYLRIEGERHWSVPANRDTRPANPLIEGLDDLGPGPQEAVSRLPRSRVRRLAAATTASPRPRPEPAPKPPLRISARSRRRFYELCVADGNDGGIIGELYQERGITRAAADGDRSLAPEQRQEAEAHERTLDLDTDADNLRLIHVYIEAIAEFQYRIGPTEAADALIASLRRDRIPIDGAGRLTEELPEPNLEELDLSDYTRLQNPAVLRDYMRRISGSAHTDPAGTIGYSKELLESACKLILDDYDTDYPGTELVPLFKKAANAVDLLNISVPESKKGSRATTNALRSMTATVQALAEMRNELGLGHGGNDLSPAQVRHARLTVSLSTGVVRYLLDTWHSQNEPTG